MRNVLRGAVAALLVGCLGAGPALASPERPLGSIIFADRALLSSNLATAGATVFAGDQLATGETGALRVHLGNGQIYLPPKSAAAVEEMLGGIGAKLLSGTVNFSSSGEHATLVRASDALIRPKTTELTHGQVQLVGPRELVISSYRGSLEVIVGSETYLVPTYTSYRLLLDPQGPQGTGAGATKGHRALWIALGTVGVAAVVGVVAWRANISHSSP